MPKFTRMAALLLVAVAVVLAILAFSIGRRAVMPVAGEVVTTAHVPSGSATVPVVVAARALPAGTPLDASSLKLAFWAQRPADGYGDVDSVAGDVPLIDIPAGAPVTTMVLARGLAMALKPGERALAVPVDEQAGAGNRILPGDYVDVFVSLKAPQTISYQPTSRDAVPDTSQTRLLLSRLRVLAYGSDDLPPAPAKSSTAPSVDDGKARPAADADARPLVNTPQSQPAARDVPRTAVLAVPVGEASALLLGVQNGKLSLGVRQPNDDGQPDDALFPPPRAVLSARADLSTDQRQQLLQPENRAYAGIDGTGLAGRDQALEKPVRPGRPPAYQSIQIIRGSSEDSARPARIDP